MEIEKLSGVPARTLKTLKSKNILTVRELAELKPKKFTDYRTIKNIKEIPDGECAAISGFLKSVNKKTTKDGKKQYISMKAEQKDGTPFLIIMFSNIYLFEYYLQLERSDIVVCGKISYSFEFGYTIIPDLISSTDTFRPFIKKTYKKFRGVSEDMLCKAINEALYLTEDPLEPEVISKFNIPEYRDCLYRLHHAENEKDIKNGKNRLLLNDLSYLAICLEKDSRDNVIDAPVFREIKTTKKFIENLPFKLTADQLKAVNLFTVATMKGKRNNVLLQGDVGCGKTIVAACCMMLAAENGYQSVLMAPRSVLAKQHYDEISGYAEANGRTCVYLHSGMKAAEKRSVYEKIKNGEADFIIGTHSCISEGVEYCNLGLVITDEEHLFGVDQKTATDKKAVPGYHKISMSATPIPRSVAEILYGNTHTIMSIKTKPAGRKEIITRRADNRAQLFEFMDKQINRGNRCYVVCPAIEDDEEGNLVSIDTVKKEYEKHFGKENISIINGKMKKNEISEEMEKFVNGTTSLLISTTVIEVGVNVPEATVMVIEQADRFGLASLHQLRGRVGRSERQSYCFLISEDTLNERIKTLVRTNDGFEIAEADLILRGSGNIIGTEQSGFNKYIEEMTSHPKLYNMAKEIAKFCIDNNYGKQLIENYEESETRKKEKKEK